MSEIYLDCHATTPLDPRVFEQMQPWMVGTPANAHAQQHNFGQRAEDAVAVARSQVARLIGARAHEVVFTSGATEANNLALLGVCSSRHKVLVSAMEHPSIGACVQALEQAGKKVEEVPVNRDGMVDLDALQAKVDDTTALVSIMLANHEVGTVQPMRQIADIVRSSGARLHTDATQAAESCPSKSARSMWTYSVFPPTNYTDRWALELCLYGQIPASCFSRAHWGAIRNLD